MRRHFLGMFQRASIGEIGSDSRRPKRMITDRRENANRLCPPADHFPGVRLAHRPEGQFDTTMTLRGAEQEALAVVEIKTDLQRMRHGAAASESLEESGRIVLFKEAATDVQAPVEARPRPNGRGRSFWDKVG